MRAKNRATVRALRRIQVEANKIVGDGKPYSFEFSVLINFIYRSIEEVLSSSGDVGVKLDDAIAVNCKGKTYDYELMGGVIAGVCITVACVYNGEKPIDVADAREFIRTIGLSAPMRNVVLFSMAYSYGQAIRSMMAPGGMNNMLGIVMYLLANGGTTIESSLYEGLVIDLYDNPVKGRSEEEKMAIELMSVGDVVWNICMLTAVIGRLVSLKQSSQHGGYQLMAEVTKKIIDEIA